VSQTLERLHVLGGEIRDLERTASLLAWDQETMLPPDGAAARADQRATLGRVVHERLVSEELGRLLEELRGEEESLPRESDDACLIRLLRREHEKARRVPTELRAELSRAGALGLGAWLEARERRDFDVLRPHLERQLELKRRYIECFAPYDDPYDVLLDDYEEGQTAAETERVLEHVKRELVPLVTAVREGGADEEGPLEGPFPVDRQTAFAHALLERFGFEERSWRLDRSQHPFSAGLSIADIRLTSRFDEKSLSGVFACMHEFGHGLYERQVARELERTPLAGGASAALHESQSRMWENLVGRGRAFWTYAYDDLRAALPEGLGGVDLDRFYRAINRIRPSLVRVDADEITYNLHIVLRFELERDLLGGRLEVRDMPAAFDERMVSYLGLEPPDVTLGVLQDIHWGDATFGYFPTYSLGNVMSVQIWERARRDLGGLDAQIERGELEPLREWLREHLHRHGRKFTPRETLLRAAGAELDPEPYVRYLKGKLGEVAGAPVS
jgi:carboxypeptidase Taq